MDSALTFRSETERQQFNDSMVRNTIIQVYSYYLSGKQPYDYGSIQYDYLERWGVIELNAWEAYKEQADRRDRDRRAMMFLCNKDGQNGTEALAKLMMLARFFEIVKQSGRSMADYLKDYEI